MVSGNLLTNDDLGDAPTTVTLAAEIGGTAVTPDGTPYTTLKGATLTINANGNYSYLPSATGTPGTEVINYLITDSDGDESSAMLEITVSAVPAVTVTHSAYTSETLASSHSVVWPALSAGERLIAAIVSDGNRTITMPAGFVTRGATSVNTRHRAEIFELNFDASGQPTGAILLSSSERIQVTMFVVTGHEPGQAIEVAANSSQMSGGNSSTIVYSTVTPSWALRMRSGCR